MIGYKRLHFLYTEGFNIYGHCSLATEKEMKEIENNGKMLSNNGIDLCEKDIVLYMLGRAKGANKI